MSALEPDAPHQHLWPHWREAVRDWAVGRCGRRPSRGSVGSEPRGKAAELGDRLAVGRVLAELGLLVEAGGQAKLTEDGARVLDVALRNTPRSSEAEGGAKALEVLIAKVERRLRRRGLVRPAAPRSAMARWRFTDSTGQERDHGHLVDSG
jgi:hypothetical protein